MSLKLRVRSSAIREWMDIPLVTVPLRKICQQSVADSSKIHFFQEWKEREILPKILNVLGPLFEEWCLDFNAFRTCWMAIPDLASSLAFSTYEEPLDRLSGEEMSTQIDPQLLLPTAPDNTHCFFNVHIVGLAAHYLTEHF